MPTPRTPMFCQSFHDRATTSRRRRGRSIDLKVSRQVAAFYPVLPHRHTNIYRKVTPLCVTDLLQTKRGGCCRLAVMCDSSTHLQHCSRPRSIPTNVLAAHEAIGGHPILLDRTELDQVFRMTTSRRATAPSSSVVV